MIPSSVRYCTVSYGSTEVLSYEGRATKVSIFVPSKVHYVYVYMYVYNKLFLLSNFRKYESTFVQPFMTTVHVRVHVRVQYMYVQRREKKRICVLYSILVGLRKYNYTYSTRTVALRTRASGSTRTCILRRYLYEGS